MHYFGISMAKLWKQWYVSGEEYWRMQINTKGVPTFSLNFKTREDGCDWIAKHEGEYLQNPEKYIQWKKKIPCDYSIWDEVKKEKLLLRQMKRVQG
jgi:hypothetical protein